MKKKILAGITKDQELYFLEIDPTNDRRNGYKEFSMSGLTVSPITEEEAKEQEVNYFDDEGEYYWREAVRAKSTTLGLDEWIEEAKEEAESLDNFDNSLFDLSVEVDGTDYLFSSNSCGQHEEGALAHYFIDPKLYNAIMAIWKRWHLKEITSGSDLAIIDEALAIKQDHEALAIEAIKIINK
jgi:hypothetical protein